jgi:DNA invertase Pin-like site-specific DNA recombinase
MESSPGLKPRAGSSSFLGIAREYVEEGFSGQEAHRPAFRKMLEDVLRPGNDVAAIIVHHTSRFTRDATEARIAKSRLRKVGVRVVSVRQDIADDPFHTNGRARPALSVAWALRAKRREGVEDVRDTDAAPLEATRVLLRRGGVHTGLFRRDLRHVTFETPTVTGSGHGATM